MSNLLKACAIALASIAATGANASFVSPVTVQLLAPGGVPSDSTPISESASVDTAVGLIAGDASNNISGFWMLPSEQITFSGNSILLHVDAGYQDLGTGALSTGYLGSGGSPAEYSISGLMVAGATITGVQDVVVSGVKSGTGVSFSGGTVNFDLDALLFDASLVGSDGYAYGQFQIDLATVPNNNNGVPEPASLALVAAGLLAGAACRRRRA